MFTPAVLELALTDLWCYLQCATENSCRHHVCGGDLQSGEIEINATHVNVFSN